ncbi:MAG: metal-dependent transcriptional regulator [Planctomycetota bacterium]|jgi:DtxR family Mn-dependent transcriptional regulator
MELTDRAEEILEMLWVETVEHKRVPDINALKDNASFRKLSEEGYLSLEEKQLLTAKGIDEGRLCVRRHRLAERLLVDVLHVKAGLVHETGCKLEHILHKGLEDNICILLGHPKSCPHGKAIPPGKCCKDRKKMAESLVMPLSEMEKGQRGKIAYIHTNDRTMLRKIMAMGALPGSSITVNQRFPSYVFQIGQSQFAVDKNVAEQIQVWLSR